MAAWGQAQLSAGKAESAAQALLASVESARRIGERRSEAARLVSLGAACEALEQRDLAAGYLRQALEIAGDLGEASIEAAARSRLGLALAAQVAGPHPDAALAGEAIEHLQRAADLAGASGDPAGQGRLLSSLGGVQVGRDDAAAAAAYRRAAELASETGDRQAEAIRLHNQGLALARLGDRPAAIESFALSLGIKGRFCLPTTR